MIKFLKNNHKRFFLILKKFIKYICKDYKNPQGNWKININFYKIFNKAKKLING